MRKFWLYSTLSGAVWSLIVLGLGWSVFQPFGHWVILSGLATGFFTGLFSIPFYKHQKPLVDLAWPILSLFLAGAIFAVFLFPIELVAGVRNPDRPFFNQILVNWAGVFGFGQILIPLAFLNHHWIGKLYHQIRVTPLPANYCSH